MPYKYSITAKESWFDSTEDMFASMQKAGYRAIDSRGGAYRDTPVEEKEYCKQFRTLAKRYDIELFQAHVPILINRPEDEFVGKDYFNVCVRALERMSRLGITRAAVHGYVPEGLDLFRNGQLYDYSKLEEHNRELNLRFFSTLAPIAKKEGIKLYIENLFAYDVKLAHHVASTCTNPNETLYYISQLGSDVFGACYDSGHLNHSGEDEYKFITTLGSHLGIVHFNESWGKDFAGMDWHHLPGDGDVNWQAVKRGLNDIGYTGTINAELKLRPEPKLMRIQLQYVVDAFKALLED